MSKKWKVVGISFDHMHMGDLLRQAHEHPNAEIIGICDDNLANTESVQRVTGNFSISPERVFSDYKTCLESTQPDIVILCPATARHGEYVEKVAPFGVNVLVEKPFAATLQEADAMINAMQSSGKTMVINWPLAWYPPHVTSKRLIDEGVIGEVIEVHYYDGNRGPMRHVADKIEISEAEAAARKNESWFYQKDKGGGSLLDYLGYGTTLGTWFHGGASPLEVTCMIDSPPGLEVDEHSITIARYDKGLSKFETRWGTFTDPWMHQPQPKCGFHIVGTQGTIASYDYEPIIKVQTREAPNGEYLLVDKLDYNRSNPIAHLIDVLENGTQIHGPLDPKICRIGQQIVDSAILSAREKRTVELVK